MTNSTFSVLDFFQIVLFQYLQVVSGISSRRFFKSTAEIVLFYNTHSIRKHGWQKRCFYQVRPKSFSLSCIHPIQLIIIVHISSLSIKNSHFMLKLSTLT